MEFHTILNNRFAFMIQISQILLILREILEQMQTMVLKPV